MVYGSGAPWPVPLSASGAVRSLGRMLIAEDFRVAYHSYPTLPYHNFLHAMEVMEEAHRLGRTINVSQAELDVAATIALYHDVIYVPGSQTNEQESAAFATSRLSWRCSYDFVSAVRQGILDTKAHQPSHRFIASCLVSDADMAGFAADWETFADNNRRVDDEFLIHGGADPEVYAQGRRKFLEATLADARSERLFHVPTISLPERHERAVANLERAIAELPA